MESKDTSGTNGNGAESLEHRDQAQDSWADTRTERERAEGRLGEIDQQLRAIRSGGYSGEGATRMVTLIRERQDIVQWLLVNVEEFVNVEETDGGARPM